MDIMSNDHIKQLFEGTLLQNIFDKIYLVDLASRSCGELATADFTIPSPQGYDNWLISLAEKMYKPDAIVFFGQMNLQRICQAITAQAPRCIVYYRHLESACIQEYRLSICYADDSLTQLVFLQEKLLKDYPKSPESVDELLHCNERFKFLTNRLTSSFTEVNIETGICHVFSDENSTPTCSIFKEQIALWAENNIVLEEREAYIQEYELERLTRSLRANNGYHSATYTSCSDTSLNSILITSALVKEAYGGSQEYIFIYEQDITHFKAQETRNKQLVDISQQLLTLSQTDPVTGLFNRTACERLIEEHLAATKNVVAGTMLLIDIDHFKDFNDKYGHSTGDFVLKFLGKTMQDIFRSDDIVSRWGGDEFVVFMRDVRDKKMITSRIERLRARLRQCKKDTRELPITISIGGEIAAPGLTMNVIFEHCDKSLYRVKSQGRNNYIIFSE